MLVNSPPFYQLDESIYVSYCVEQIKHSTSIFGALKNNSRLFFSMRRLLKKQKTDITISFMTTSNVLSLLASKSLGIPTIISERSNPYVYTHNSFWNALIKYSFPKAKYLVVQSELIRDYFANIVNIDKIKILPNPISESLTSTKQIPQKREQIILNVGRLDQNKAQDLLIRAFANVNHHSWKLIFIGNGERRSYYEELVDDLNLNDKVIFTGNISDVESYYNSASIFAFTSRSEGFPNALIEAMYFELACISTNCPTGPSEIINDGDNGFLIDVDHQTQLEDRLEQLMHDSTLRQSFGSKAYHTAISFEASHVAEQWHKLITSAL